jgi:catechol 2,3-dioxygenase-like lactoylglutathione lyase family enzyme
MIPVHGLSELVLEVRDLAQAERFYGEILGFELKRWDARVTSMEAPGCRVQLRLYGTPGHRGAGPCHYAFSVEPEDIPAIAEHLKAHGLLARGPVDFGDGGTSVFCFDPDGNEVEFMDYFRRRARQSGGKPPK